MGARNHGSFYDSLSKTVLLLQSTTVKKKKSKKERAVQMEMNGTQATEVIKNVFSIS